jgi:tetratricopeptide (TPR) repeat protein
MKLSWLRSSLLVAVFASVTCNAATDVTPIDSAVRTTSSSIAIANLDQQIVQSRDEAGVEDLLLVRSRFLADYDALVRASSLGEGRFGTAREFLVRARTRASVHRFADALADLALAEHAAANAEEVKALRASILVATGRAAEVIAELEEGLRQHPSFASFSTLAGAYAAIGRYVDADRLYAEALKQLNTTLPFPYAWIYFARALMWSEQAGDQARARTLYEESLKYLPEFVPANIHLAELEALGGDFQSAIVRLEHVIQSSNEPEALALLGVLHTRAGESARGIREIANARARYEGLLETQPLAFADHAAEFYLGPGADPRRAWALAQQNLANRQTPRAAALAIKAAEASGNVSEASALLQRYPDSVKPAQLQIKCKGPTVEPILSRSTRPFSAHHRTVGAMTFHVDLIGRKDLSGEIVCDRRH